MWIWKIVSIMFFSVGAPSSAELGLYKKVHYKAVAKFKSRSELIRGLGPYTTHTHRQVLIQLMMKAKVPLSKAHKLTKKDFKSITAIGNSSGILNSMMFDKNTPKEFDILLTRFLVAEMARGIKPSFTELLVDFMDTDLRFFCNGNVLKRIDGSVVGAKLKIKVMSEKSSIFQLNEFCGLKLKKDIRVKHVNTTSLLTNYMGRIEEVLIEKKRKRDMGPGSALMKKNLKLDN